MKKLIYHILRRLPGILLVMLAVVPSMAQIVVDQCDTMQFSVTSRPSIPETHFVWAIYPSSNDPTDVLDPTGSLDPSTYFADGMYAGRTVSVVGLDPGTYYVRIHVWDEVTCTDNIEMYVMEVIEQELDAYMVGDSACIGDPAVVKIVFTGKGPYNVVYTFGDEFNSVNLNGITDPEYTIPVAFPVGTTEFWVMEVSNDCVVKSYTVPEKARLEIYPKPTSSQIYQVDK